MTPPPSPVLAAFGARTPPHRLPGGRGGTWRSGDLILKPVAFEPESRWRAATLDALPDDPEVRIARPVRTRDGDWLCGGWEASRAVAGDPDPARADDVIRAGEAFHRSLAAVPRPAFLDQRHNPWSYADRLAWGGARTEAPRRRSALVDRLLAARRPVREPARIVHGDLLGNVLFSPGHPPAVIDWAPYWRPPAWAAAIVVVDATTWHGAALTTTERWAHLPDWPQMLIRALIFRIATWDTDGRAAEPEEAYHPAAAHALSLAT